MARDSSAVRGNLCQAQQRRRGVTFDRSVAAVEDAGDSDFPDALREQRGFGGGDAGVEVEVADSGIVTRDGFGIDGRGVLRRIIEVGGAYYVRQHDGDVRGKCGLGGRRKAA